MRALLFVWAVQGFAAFNLTWGIPAVTLDSNPPPGDTDLNAAIAIDPEGNAIATWGRTSGREAKEDIYASVYNHSSRVWIGPVKISGGGNASNARLAMDPDGTAIFVWEEGFPTEIKSRTLSPDGIWDPPLDLPAQTVAHSINPQTLPQIAVDGAGNSLAIWLEFYDQKFHIHSAKKNSGQNWTPLDAISSELYSAHLLPKNLVMNESGAAIAVWEESRNAIKQIQAAQFTNGNWSSPIAIRAQSEIDCQSPSVGIDKEGNCIIVWTEGVTIQSNILSQGTLLKTPLLVSNPAYKSAHPFVGVAANGDALVVFERCDSLHKFISGSKLPFKTLQWTPPVDISGPSHFMAAGAGYPVLSVNSIGDGVVIWKEYDGEHTIIQGAGHSLNTWSFTKTLSSLDDNAGAPATAYDIDVSLNDTGNILAVWPEDPSKIGSQQIKATSGVGLANRAPQPPVIKPETLEGGIATGKQVLHRFPAHSDLINILTWNSPGDVAYYKIYRGNLSSLIGTTISTTYEDHQRIPQRNETYLVTSVDANGQESCPTTIVVMAKNF